MSDVSSVTAGRLPPALMAPKPPTAEQIDKAWVDDETRKRQKERRLGERRAVDCLNQPNELRRLINQVQDHLRGAGCPDLRQNGHTVVALLEHLAGTPLTYDPNDPRQWWER